MNDATPGPQPRRRKRLLLLTYPFPPVGGAGVQRVTKFAKYLPQQGWDVSVLTVANPSVPVFDESLTKDVPPDTLIRRAPSWEPGYRVKASVVAGSRNGATRSGGLKQVVARFARRVGAFVLQPDPQVLWMPNAVAEGRRLLRQVDHDAIVASGPPFSTFLIGASLARHTGLPLILDYRDEWTISNEYWENKRLDPLSRYLQGRMQRWVIRVAQGLVATTQCSAQSLSQMNRQVGDKARVTWIYNGFDPDDFSAVANPTPRTNGTFTLAYVGTLWNLTSIAPIIEAVRRLSQSTPDLAGKLEIVVAGRRTEAQADVLTGLQGLPCRLVELPYLDHSAAVRLMRDCQARLLLLSDLPGAERVVPAKLFEYMATGRPTLTIAPPGEARDLLQGYPGGQFPPSDISGIASWLATAIKAHSAGNSQSAVGWDATRFTRQYQAGQLASFLNELLPSDSGEGFESRSRLRNTHE